MAVAPREGSRQPMRRMEVLVEGWVARDWIMARPMPRLPPVTRITFWGDGVVDMSLLLSLSLCWRGSMFLGERFRNFDVHRCASLCDAFNIVVGSSSRSS